MNRSAFTALAALGAFALGSAAAADEQSAMERARLNPDHAFALRFQLSAEVRAACGIDSSQSLMSMRIWQRQHECLRDYFNGTLR
ncbi:MAG: hypothetical protein JSS00_09550 [Proteobacteria bacterium]|nr:hypothetical protein [Pseudomonadota bacterium]